MYGISDIITVFKSKNNVWLFLDIIKQIHTFVASVLPFKIKNEISL